MHDEICKFPSAHVYRSKLKTDKAIHQKRFVSSDEFLRSTFLCIEKSFLFGLTSFLTPFSEKKYWTQRVNLTAILWKQKSSFLSFNSSTKRPKSHLIVGFLASRLLSATTRSNLLFSFRDRNHHALQLSAQADRTNSRQKKF